MSHSIYEQTFYELLEVNPSAPQNEIHHAYQRAKETYSPDSPALYTMFTKEEAHELMRLIDEAYQVLSSQSRRHQYDLQLKQNQIHLQQNLINNPDLSTQIAYQSAYESPVHQHTSFAQPKKAEPLPKGFAKTKFGVYEIDKSFEEQIQQTEQFDGSIIQKVRMYKNISLEQLSEETRISRSYIGAIESNAYESLPAPVFVRGFVVQISRCLGLDDNLVAKTYMQKYKASRV